MTLAKLDPLYKEFSRINRLFGGDTWEPNGIEAAEWTPAVDILEGENEIVIKAELPGMNEKDIVVSLDNNVLTLRGDRHFEKDVKKENYHRMERTYGTFFRSFTLPAFVDVANVKAEYKDGLLKIALPKKETAKARRVEVAAA